MIIFHQYDVCKNYVGSLSVCWWSGESGLCVFRESCPVRFIVVGESPSILL